MAAKKSIRTTKKFKNLDVKAKDVRGGGANIFVKYGDIQGESTDSGHDKWIEVMTYTPKK